MLVPRGVLEEKERGALQRWFDMIDWQGVGIKEEQQAQGGMRFYVRGQTRTKRWVEEQEQAGTEGNEGADVELKDYIEVLRRFNEARKIGEDAEKVLKEMNPGAQPTMAAVALREWLVDSSKELDHEGEKTGGVKSDTGFSHSAEASKSSRETLASAIQLKPGSTEADTEMGEVEQTSSAKGRG